MKKVLLGLVIILIAVGLFWWFRRPRYQAEDLLPQDTLLFVSSSNFRQTQKNLKQCPTGKMLDEPSVRKFISESFKSIQSSNKEFFQNTMVQRLGTTLTSVDGELFFAITDFFIIPDLSFEMILGFEADSKSLAAFQKWIDDSRIEQPSIQTETGEWHGFAYQVIVLPNRHKLVYMRAGNLMILTWGENAIRTVISQLEDKTAPSLAKHPFLTTHSVTQEIDLRVLLNPQPVWSRVQKLGALQSEYTDKLQGLLAIDHVLYTTSLQQEGIRSKTWIRRNSSHAPSSLSLKSLDFTSEDTVLYGAMRFNFKEWSKSKFSELLKSPQLEMVQKGLPAIDFDGNFFKSLGSETAVVLNWPQSHELPLFCVVMEVENPVEMQKALKEVPSTTLGSLKAYSIELSGMNLSFALDGNHLILTPIGSDMAGILDEYHRNLLAKTTRKWFDDLKPRLPASHHQLFYYDPKKIFDRVYPSLRQVALDSRAQLPKISSKVDLQTLPEPTEISNHLFPSYWVGSSAEKEDEYRSESSISIPALLLGLWLNQ